MGQRPFVVRARMPTSDHRGQSGSFVRGADRLPAAASRAARDRDRLRASEAAMASEVIEFQLARQRVGLRPVEGIEPLSPREREVLALLAASRSDGEIADELFISKKTASVHVANIKGKLGASSRVEIALLAARLDLIEEGGAGRSTTDTAARPVASRVVCPFKGLASFDIADARFFFGRERIVAELVARLAGSTFVGVVGASGSGKSSVIRAGLVPALIGGVLPGSDEWSLAMIRPGAAPSTVLHRAVLAALRRAGLEQPADAGLESNLDALPAGGRLVLVVDQFEEVFTLCRDEADRSAFMRSVASLARDPDSRALVVIAVRADFYGRCAEDRDLADLLGAGHVLLGPLGTEELARAIDLPARAAGLRVEPSLTAALVGAVGREPGALPLLSTTLLDLWQRRDGRTLRLEAYERLGGVSGSVSRLAEAAVERLTPEQLAIARGILLRLVGRGDGGVLVRRPAARSALDADRDPEVSAVLEALTDSRLVAADEGTIEIAHEVLLREWPRLRAWLEEDAEGRRLHDHLARAAGEWEAAGEDPAELFRGARLTATLEWAEAHDAELIERERRFLAAGKAIGERDVARQRATNRRLRLLLAGVGALLAVALLAGLVALAQLVRAEGEASRARAGELGQAAVVVLATDPGLAALLALTSITAADQPTTTATSVLHEAIAANSVVDRYQWPADRTVGLLWTDLDPSGELIAASGLLYGPADHVEVVDRDADEVLWSYPAAPSPVMVGPAFFSSDGRRLIAGIAAAGGARPAADEVGGFVWDARSGAPIRHLDLGPCGGFVSDVSGTHLLAIVQTPALDDDACPAVDPRDDAALVLVDLLSGERSVLTDQTLTVDIDGPGALSGDGRIVAYEDLAGDEATVVLEDVRTGVRHLELPAAEVPGWVRGLNDDGSLLLVGDRPMTVLDVSGAEARVQSEFAGHAGASYAAEFGPSGPAVYSTGRDSSLRIWDGTTGAELTVRLAIGSGRAVPSGDGSIVLVADSESRTAAVVDLRPRPEVGLIETCRALFVSATSLQVADGLAVFQETCDDDPAFNGVTQVVDVDAGAVRYSLVGWEGQTLAISPDGEAFVKQEYAAPTVGPLAIHDLRTGALVRELDGLCRWEFGVPRDRAADCRPFPATPFAIWNLSIRWSPDGSMIVATDHHDDDGFVAVWSADDGRLLYRGPAERERRIFGAMFSADSGRLILTDFESGAIEVRETETWTVVTTARVDPAAGGGRLYPVGYDVTGSAIVAVGEFLGTSGGSLHWLDPATLQPLHSPATDIHEGSLKAVALSPDRSRIATGSSDGSVRVWRTSDGGLIDEIRVPGSEVQGVAFRDDDHLVVTPADGTVRIYTLDVTELVRIARSAATRTFTPVECARFGIDPCPTLEQLRGG